MRISGYGTNYDSPNDDGRRDRAATFRKRHNIGQRVRGRILRLAPNGLTWVLVGDTELLARLEVAATPGDMLSFIVRELDPEIVLQALAPGQAAADLPGLLQRFRAAREIFEKKSGGILMALTHAAAVPGTRRDAFLTALKGDAEAHQALDVVFGILGQINSNVDPKLGMEAWYLPWLFPEVRRAEAWRKGENAAFGAESPRCGAFEVRFSGSGGEDHLRLFCESPAESAALRDALLDLAESWRGRKPEIELARLVRPTPRGGVLGEILGGEALQWSAGGLNTRV